MYFKIKLIFLMVGAAFFVDVKAGSLDFYKKISLDAVSANIDYYTLYLECFQSNSAQHKCTRDDEDRSPTYINNILIIKNSLSEKRLSLYRKDELLYHPREKNIEQARENFYHEALYLQIKLLIFMANVEKDCGHPESYQALISLSGAAMDYYIQTPSKEDIQFLNDYKKLKFDQVYKNKDECKIYLQKNSPIFHEVFSAQFDGMEKKMNKENLLSLFVYLMMKDLVDEMDKEQISN